VYVARSNSPRVVSIGFHAGARVPAHVVGPGAVLLAALPDEALQAWVAVHAFAGFSAGTVTDAQAYLAQVRAARGQDHWISRGALDPGLVGVAVPLKDRRGETKAAIGLTLQAQFWDDAQITAKLVPALLETAQTLRPLV
jgi:IclR family pca regulon transcriptional regulator